MKKLRRVLMVLGAPAAALLGLTQLGGTPLYKGYNTGLTATPLTNSVNQKLAISTDSGDLMCWVKLRLPLHAQSLSATLSNGSPLSVYQESVQDADQWVAIVAEGQKREEKFKWPSGAILFVTTNGGSAMPSDWRVYLSDQAFDSKDRARWRSIAFSFSVVFLFLSLAGLIFEGLEKRREEPTTSFTHERCLNELIMSTEGGSSQETEWMRSILRKVLLQTVTVADAIAPIPLQKGEKWALWFKTRNQFRLRLERLITDLNVDLSYLRP
jgi:hypothetical protein